MATQVKSGLPSGEFIVIDNGAAGAVSTNLVPYSKGSGIGTDGGTGSMTGAGVPNFDLTANGAVAQGTNPFADTGSTTLDMLNDTIYSDPQNATVLRTGLTTPPTYATVSTVLNSVSGQRLLWKNPA